MITPSDSPSAPSEYSAVPVSGWDIQAPQADLAGTFDAANAAAGAGALYPKSERQQQAQAVLESPQGYGEFDVTGGYHGDWPANVEPGG